MYEECLMIVVYVIVVFFFKQKTAYEMRISDWSSDVCSSDLAADLAGRGDQRATQHRFRAGGELGDRQVRLSRQERADHADRPAVLGLAGGLGADLCAVVRRAGLVRPVAPGA